MLPHALLIGDKQLAVFLVVCDTIEIVDERRHKEICPEQEAKENRYEKVNARPLGVRVSPIPVGSRTGQYSTVKWNKRVSSKALLCDAGESATIRSKDDKSSPHCFISSKLLDLCLESSTPISSQTEIEKPSISRSFITPTD